MTPPSGRSDVVLLAVPGWATEVVHAALCDRFGDVPLVLEDPLPRSTLLRRRAKRLGIPAAIGQALFMLCAVPILRRLGRRRIAELSSSLSRSTAAATARLASVNTPAARSLLEELSPRVVVINGTRIVSEATLAATPARFVNMHAGITPRYRGVHGGYWALVDDRPDLVGTTVHLVDRGIDTGGILAQATWDPEPSDSFVTYPYRHVQAGLPQLLDAVDDLLADRPVQPIPALPGAESSALRHHPTLWAYLRHRLRGVR